MGLTRTSTGTGAAELRRKAGGDGGSRKQIALAGNPNVGKSTVFNHLTGMRQHTGNWSGKTVTNARGICTYNSTEYLMTDIPGCYSLSPRSAEEEVARDLLCSGQADAVVVVCAASSLSRGLSLALQIMEITPQVVVCVNLMDEASAKGIVVDSGELERQLGVPVVESSARSGRGMNELMQAVEHITQPQYQARPFRVGYPAYIEAAISWMKPSLEKVNGSMARHTALELLSGESSPQTLKALSSPEVVRRLEEAQKKIYAQEISPQTVCDDITSAPVRAAANICCGVVSGEKSGYGKKDRAVDKILTGRWTAYPIMLMLLLVVFWLTLTGANYPSELLRSGFNWMEERLLYLMNTVHCPKLLTDMLVFGVFRILGWVVSVMLPPMAIFFPLFTILEDSGFLPRLAFNMDHSFKRCGACGKQALTIAMGFGCNAAGVTGCRIIDSPRERLIAILTNSLVPCNGKFPMLAAIITMFLTAGLGGAAASAASSLLLAAAVVLSIAVTFAVSRLLSKTLLRGVPSSFVLELPPYRMPQWGKVIVRSIFDRTLFVLGRAAATAAPAGLLLWVMANIQTQNGSLLAVCSSALDPIGQLMGMDGVILLAFILGFPANEIVVPIIIMIYTAQGALTDLSSLDQMYALLSANGWTWVTGACVVLFSLMHWPCSTTCITVYRETGSLRWTALAIALPTVFGTLACMLFRLVAGLFV